MRLYRVTSPRMVAGFTTQNGRVVETAPILREALSDLTEQGARDECRRRGWQYTFSQINLSTAESARSDTLSPGEGHPLYDLFTQLPSNTKLSFAPDWGYFIQKISNRERLSSFHPSAEEALVNFIEQGPEKIY